MGRWRMPGLCRRACATFCPARCDRAGVLGPARLEIPTRSLLTGRFPEVIRRTRRRLRDGPGSNSYGCGCSSRASQEVGMMQFGSIGLLHPGEMGAAVGGVLAGEHRVWWASSGRSPASARRASAVGLTDVGSVEAIRSGCELIISICPPEAAREVTRQVSGFQGVYLDANAIAPATAREVATLIEAGGGSYLDGESSAGRRPLVRAAPASTCREQMARRSPSSSPGPQRTPVCFRMTRRRRRHSRCALPRGRRGRPTHRSAASMLGPSRRRCQPT